MISTILLAWFLLSLIAVAVWILISGLINDDYDLVDPRSSYYDDEQEDEL